MKIFNEWRWLPNKPNVWKTVCAAKRNGCGVFDMAVEG
jgi:hypothetical protein